MIRFSLFYCLLSEDGCVRIGIRMFIHPDIVGIGRFNLIGRIFQREDRGFALRESAHGGSDDKLSSLTCAVG